MVTKSVYRYCPRSDCKGVGVRQGEVYVCNTCKGMFDGNPDEGGTHSHDPTRRIEREDERRARRFPRRQRFGGIAGK